MMEKEKNEGKKKNKKQNKKKQLYFRPPAAQAAHIIPVRLLHPETETTVTVKSSSGHWQLHTKYRKKYIYCIFFPLHIFFFFLGPSGCDHPTNYSVLFLNQPFRLRREPQNKKRLQRNASALHRGDEKAAQ